MIISQQNLKELLSYDAETGRFIWLVDRTFGIKAGALAGHTNKRDGYPRIKVMGRTYQAHRLAWFYTYGTWPSTIDHKDRVRTNNALSNLREATPSQNLMNTDINPLNTSGHRGVTWNKMAGKWQAQSRINARHHYLGLFTDSSEAARVCEEFRKAHHGEFFVPSKGVAA